MKKSILILLTVLMGCASTVDVTLTKHDNFDGTGNIMWGKGEPWGEYHPRFLRHYWDYPVITDGYAYFMPEYKPKTFKDTIVIPYKVGKMYTFHEQKYGYWEARVLFNKGEGTRHAFWMWTAPPYCEIDIFEVDGHSEAQKMNLHYGERINSKSQQIGPIYRKTAKDGEWQVFGFLWTPDKMVWYVDGKVVKRLCNNKILEWLNENDIEVWTLLSQSVRNDDPKGSMIVDWIRIYELNE